VIGGLFSLPVYIFMIIYIIILAMRIDNDKYDLKSSLSSEQDLGVLTVTKDQFDIALTFGSYNETFKDYTYEEVRPYVNVTLGQFKFQMD